MCDANSFRRQRRGGRRVAPVLCLVALALAGLTGCGDPPAGPDPAADPGAPGAVAERGDGPATPAPHREVVTAEMNARVKGHKLPPRDEPLVVGLAAPTVEGTVAGRAAVIVFYRGHW